MSNSGMEFLSQIKHPTVPLCGINLGIWKKVAITGGNSSHKEGNKRKKLGLWNWPAHWGENTSGRKHLRLCSGHIPANLTLALGSCDKLQAPLSNVAGAAGCSLHRHGWAKGLKKATEGETLSPSLLREEYTFLRWFRSVLFCLVLGSGYRIHAC